MTYVVTLQSTSKEISALSAHSSVSSSSTQLTDQTGEPSPEWFTEFFTELPNEFWRRAATPEMTAADVDFVETRLGLAPGSRIIDVPCGSGRHSLALAERGHRVTGVDLSAEAIEHARRAAAATGTAVKFVLGDMREIAPSGSFDAAVCLGNSFGYLTPAQTAEFVRSLAAAVRPGGGLVLDFGATAESVLPGFTGEARVMRTGDITTEATVDYDVARSRMLSRYRFTRGDDVLDTTAVHHVYTCGHIGDLLGAAGFTDIGRHSDPDGTPYRLGAGRLLVTARRGLLPAVPSGPQQVMDTESSRS
ncbi:Methyltransferase type 11 [Frankia sp. Hr75.2]|nr:Methyltransferase type 11 [Frankia sp. Hr75.2]